MQKNIYVHLFVSRRKDNTDLSEFVPRKKSFVAYEWQDVSDSFDDFVSEGQPGEYCRHYISVNPRDEDKVRNEMVIHLLRVQPSVTKIPSLVASIASRPECAAEHRWLLDFDSNDPQKAEEFMADLREYFSEDEAKLIEMNPTPNGYAIIVPHGFDTRKLQKKWLSIFENKRDAMLFVDARDKQVKKI